MRCDTPAVTGQNKAGFYRRLSSIVFVMYLGTAGLVQAYPAGRFGLAVSLASGALFFAVLVTGGLLVAQRMDEFQRTLLTQSFLWATIGTMGFASIYGYVEAAPGSHVPHLPLLVLPVTLVLLTVATKAFFFRRNRADSE